MSGTPFHGISTKVVAALTHDALLSAMRCLVHFKQDRDSAVKTLDRLADRAAREHMNIVSVIADENVPVQTPLAAVVLAMWFPEMVATVGTPNARLDDTLMALKMYWEQALPDVPDAEDRLMEKLLVALDSLGEFPTDAIPAQDEAITACDAFRELALALARRDDSHAALSCAQAAANLSNLVPPIDALNYSQLSLDLARQHSDPKFISMELTRQALGLAKMAKTDPARQAEAFDAIESALRYYGLEPAARPDGNMIQAIREWVDTTDFLKPLRALLAMVFAESINPQMPLAFRQVIERLTPVWPGSLEAWIEPLDTFIPFNVEMENRRLALLPPLRGIQAEVFWSTAAFDHQRLRRSVPHMRSILREKNLDDLLLEISHEVTHVLSMTGQLGIAIACLRWVQFDWEFDLWGRQTDSDIAKEKTVREHILNFQPTRTAPADPVLLACAERILVLERKIQILQRVWSPWFEGLAVFGELHADPTDSLASRSPLTSVVANLQDRSMASEAKERHVSIEEAARLCLEEAEKLIATAQQKIGAQRLNVYLDSAYQDKYLAGYLAIRGVVAAWRSTSRSPISGSDAFMVLLHATRFTRFEELLPDLTLPLDDFAREAVGRHRDWVAALMRADPADIAAAISDYDRGESQHGYQWHDGKLRRIPIGEALEKDINRRFTNLMENALKSPSLNAGAPGRIEGADALGREVQKIIDQAFEERGAKSAFPLEVGFETLLRGRTILPVARAEFPFWLIPGQQQAFVLLRTREESADTGKPGYNSTTIPLNKKSQEQLLAELRRLGKGRMRVTRVAALATPNQLRNGSNFLVFQYGDWSHVQRVGMLLGGELEDQHSEREIRNRLKPDDLYLAFQRSTEDDHPGARATATWIRRQGWLVEESGDDVQLQFWADAVLRLADVVLDPNDAGDIITTRRALLELLFGADTEELLQHGFEKVLNANRFGELMRALHTTGRKPVADDSLADLSNKLNELGPALFEKTDAGWDFVRPKVIQPPTSTTL